MKSLVYLPLVAALLPSVVFADSNKLCAFVDNQAGGSVSITTSGSVPDLMLASGASSAVVKTSSDSLVFDITGQVTSQVSVYFGGVQLTAGGMNMSFSNESVNGTDCKVLYHVTIYP